MSIAYEAISDIALNYLYDYGVLSTVPNTTFGPIVITDPENSYVPRFITNALVEEGAQTVAVVDYPKYWYFKR